MATTSIKTTQRSTGPGTRVGFPVEEKEMGALVEMEASPQAWVMPSPLFSPAKEIREGVGLAGALMSSGLVLQSGWVPGGGGSSVVSLSAAPWSLVAILGGQMGRGTQWAQELMADVAQNRPGRHSQTLEEFHVHGVFSTRSPLKQLTQALQRPSLSR